MEVRGKILEALRKSGGKPVSGEELASTLGLTRTAVWKHIRALRARGYVISSSTHEGYVLESIPGRLLPDEIKNGLDTSFIGREIHYFEEIESTNSEARRIAKDSAEGTVVIAEAQTGGRGRLGRKWASPPGGVWLSVLLKPRLEAAHATRITMTVGLAVAKTIRSYGLDARIKWPNDILISGRKVCGILTEIEAETDSIEYAIAGIGVNVNVDVDSFPPDFRESSTSMSRELAEDIDRVEFVRRLFVEIERAYSMFREHFDSVVDEWRKLSATIGETVRISTLARSFVGEAVGVDDSGALVVELPDGTLEKVVAGDCVHLRKA